MASELDPIAGPDGGDKGRRLAKYWLDQIGKVDAEQKRWVKRGRAIERRYRDERNRSEEEGQRRMNNLWANVQIMYPALYGKQPTPIAERRFKDKDPIGRAAASIIERALRNDLEFDDYHESMGSAVLDYLLPGRGVLWVRYEPEFERGISIPVDGQNDLRDDEGDIETEPDDEEHEKLEETGDRLIKESAPVDYISWEDAYFFPHKARKWKQVRAIGKRLYMSYDEMVSWWGEKIADQVPLQKDDKEKRDTAEGRATTDKRDDKAQVFEIWDLDQLEVVWVADGCDFLINRMDDPLGLEGFYPVPRPLAANATNTSIIPVPDYIQYQDQARQIDELTQRISQLAKACKIAGLYDASVDEIVRLLDESVENELLPVDNWRALAEKLTNTAGGQPIWLFPIEQITKCLMELMEVRKASIEDMDRLTGITDVLRGVTTDARETLGKGKLNNNNGKSRLRQRQDEVARFARDVIRIKADIMCNHFSNKSLIEMSGALYEEGLGIADVMHYGGETDGAGASSSAGAAGAGSSMSAPPAAPSLQPGLLPPMTTQPAGAAPGGSAMPPGMPSSNVVPFRPASMPGGALAQPPGMAPHNEFGPVQDEQIVLAALRKIQAALKLLRNDLKRGFRVDIETDSTIVGDEEADKQSRAEFLTAVSTFMKESEAIAQGNPDMVPVLGKMLQFGVRGFRVGRDLEASIDELCDKLDQKAKAAEGKPPPPSPEMMKAQAHVESEKIKQGGELKRIEAQSQSDKMNAQLEAQLAQVKLQLEQQKAAGDLRVKEMELRLKEVELNMKTQHAAVAHQMHMEAAMAPKPAANESHPKKEGEAA